MLAISIEDLVDKGVYPHEVLTFSSYSISRKDNLRLRRTHMTFSTLASNSMGIIIKVFSISHTSYNLHITVEKNILLLTLLKYSFSPPRTRLKFSSKFKQKQT